MDEWTDQSFQEQINSQDVSEEEDEEVDFYRPELIKMQQLDLVDIGSLAVWKVSSYKPGFGVDQLRVDDISKYWQSDGSQPHSLEIQFSKRVCLERISLYADFRLDESYTPSKIIVYSGTGHHDLQEVATLELSQPRGWSHIIFKNVREDGVMKTFLLKISIPANHQNGKDTHIRALKLYSPAQHFVESQQPQFTTVAMLSEMTLR
jgi:anaphase-promoting complex subunit 10